MRKQLKQQQSELMEAHLSNGVVEVQKLSMGTRITVTTPDEHYEFEVGTPQFGVVLVGSDGRFDSRDKVVLTGSIDPDTQIFLPGIIGQGLKIVLRRQNKPTVRTGPVLAVRVLGRNDSYAFKLWKD